MSINRIGFAKFAILLLIGTTLGACTHENSGVDPMASIPAITIGDGPALTIGDDGTPDRAFTRIFARRLANGNVAIEDEPARRIAIFDRSGQFVREITHQGSGPGEMDQPFRITSIGDTIFALPLPNVVPVSVFVANKGFVERYAPKVQNYDKALTATARMSNHHWLVKQGAAFRALTGAVDVGAVTPDTLTIGITNIGSSPESTIVNWLPPFVAAWSIGAEMSKPSPIPALPTNFPMKGATLYAASGVQLWMVDAESGAITVFDTTATAIIHDTVPTTRRPFVQSELAAARAIELESARGQFMKDLIEGRYQSKFIPVIMPRFSAIYGGDDGEVWLQVYEVNPNAAQTFVALTHNAKPIGTTMLPAGLHAQQFGRDFVLAIKTDSLGAQSVVEYTLRRR